VTTVESLALQQVTGPQALSNDRRSIMPEEITKPPKVLKFEAAPLAIEVGSGMNVTFSWTTQNTSSVLLQGMGLDKKWSLDDGGDNVLEGSYELSPGVAGDYTLTPIGDASGGPVATVTVVELSEYRPK